MKKFVASIALAIGIVLTIGSCGAANAAGPKPPPVVPILTMNQVPPPMTCHYKKGSHKRKMICWTKDRQTQMICIAKGKHHRKMICRFKIVCHFADRPDMRWAEKHCINFPRYHEPKIENLAE